MQHHNRMSVSMQRTKQTTIYRCHLQLEQQRFQWQQIFDFQITCLKNEMENIVYKLSLLLIQ